MTKNIDAIVDGLVVKALKKWNMIQKGERILIGASGGKDSSILARDLANKKRQGRIQADIVGLHIKSDFSDTDSAIEQLQDKYGSWGIELVTLAVPIQGRLKAGRRLNCYWCSTQRRTELIAYAIKHNFTAIALGHHMDDVLETLFMNMLSKGELSTMPPVVKYLKYPVKVIRPLYLLEEKQIIALASALNLTAFTCTCNYNKNSSRDLARQKLEALTDGASDTKRKILQALQNINSDYLPK